MEWDAKPRWRRWLWLGPLIWVSLTLICAFFLAWLVGAGGAKAGQVNFPSLDQWSLAALCALGLMALIATVEWLRGADLGPGRNPQFAVLSGFVGLMTGAMLWLSWDRLNPWGALAGIIWLVAAGVGVVLAISPRWDLPRERLVIGSYLAGVAVLVGWALAQPQDLVTGTWRAPDEEGVRTAGLIVGGVLILGIVAYLRGWGRQTPRRRAVSGAEGRFPMAWGNGYEIADVDAFLDRLDERAKSPEGHASTIVFIEQARFHLAEGDGYDAAAVDEYLDRLLVELYSRPK